MHSCDTVLAAMIIGGTHPQDDLLKRFKSGCDHKEATQLLEKTSHFHDIKSILTEDGQTLLHIASSSMTVSTVKLLIEQYRLDPSAQDKRGNTPLHLACSKHNTKTALFLINLLSCDPNIKNSDGDTAVHIVLSKGNYSLGRRLCESVRVDQQVANKHGKTAQMLLNCELQPKGK